MIQPLTHFHYLYGNDTALNHVRRFVVAAAKLGCSVDTHALNFGNRFETAKPTGTAQQVRAAIKRQFATLLREPKELAWNARYLGIELRVLRNERSPALLARDSLYSASYVVAARLAGIPLVIEVNAPAVDSRIYRDDYAHSPRVPEYLTGTKVQHADAVIPVSSPLRTHLIKHDVLDPSRAHVVIIGANVVKFSPDAATDAEIAAVVGGAPVAGFVGSFAEWQSPDLLRRMAALVSRRCPQMRFIFAGAGSGVTRVIGRTSEIRDRVIFTGGVRHVRVPGLVKVLDFDVLADTGFDCRPLKIQEWMSAGAAVVAPDCESVRDITADRVKGALFPRGGHDAVAELIVDPLATPGRPRSLGSAAVADDFTTALPGPQWAGMIVPLRMLAVATIVNCLHALAAAVIEATGRAKYEVLTQGAYAALIIARTVVGTRWSVEGVSYVLVCAAVAFDLLKAVTIRLAVGISTTRVATPALGPLADGALVYTALRFVLAIVAVLAPAHARLIFAQLRKLRIDGACHAATRCPPAMSR